MLYYKCKGKGNQKEKGAKMTTFTIICIAIKVACAMVKGIDKAIKNNKEFRKAIHTTEDSRTAALKALKAARTRK
jgi:hypothetical protein